MFPYFHIPMKSFPFAFPTISMTTVYSHSHFPVIPLLDLFMHDLLNFQNEALTSNEVNSVVLKCQ